MAVSGAGAGSISGAGSVTLNWIKNNVAASVQNIGAINGVAAGLRNSG